METYHTSLFSDESHERIKEIYEFLSWEQPVCQDVAIQINAEDLLGSIHNSDHESETEYVDETPSLVSYPPSDTIWSTVDQYDHYKPNTVSPHHCSKQPTEQSKRSAWFSGSKIRPSLKCSVLSNQVIDVWLITDSIMRHIDELDTRFRKYRVNFYRVDKTDTSQLSDPQLLQKIPKEQPHIICLHLGVNDVHKGYPVRRTLDNIKLFMDYVEEQSPRTKIIISTPLLNGVETQSSALTEIRKSFILHVAKVEKDRNIMDRRFFVQPNNQFFVVDNRSKLHQNGVYFQDEDKVHLSTRGKRTMKCCWRDTLHQILREHELQE